MALAQDIQNAKEFATAAANWTSNSVTPASANEVYFAIYLADNADCTAMSGGTGLTWTSRLSAGDATHGFLRVFSAQTSGTPAAFTVTCTNATAAGSLTVLSFTGADLSGTNGSAAFGASNTFSGAPATTSTTVTYTSTRDQSWGFGGGLDWTTQAAPTVGTGMTAIDTFTSTPNGDGFTSAKMTATTTPSGSTVNFALSGYTSADARTLGVFEVMPATAAPAAPVTVHRVLLQAVKRGAFF